MRSSNYRHEWHAQGGGRHPKERLPRRFAATAVLLQSVCETVLPHFAACQSRAQGFFSFTHTLAARSTNDEMSCTRCFFTRYSGTRGRSLTVLSVVCRTQYLVLPEARQG